MKMNLWLIAGTMLSAGLMAQTATNTPVETPAAAPMATNAPAETTTNAPAAKPAKKKGKKKKAVTKPKPNPAELMSEPLAAGPAEVIATSVNVRGQAKLKSEILGKLTKGQQVTVVEEVVRNNSGPDEPSAWAKILLPSTVHVWVNTTFIDAPTMTVKATKLNLRSGPGENFSVLGRLTHGDAVKQISTKDNWIEIEPPAGAYAFVAAQYLKEEGPGAPTKPPEPAATMTAVNEPPTVAAATNELVTPTAPPMAPADTNLMAGTNLMSGTNELATTNAPAPEEPLPPRIVQRQGKVRGMTSIQAPSSFELVSPESGAVLDYLYSTSTNLDLRRYKGLEIIVTGEEGLDERWKSTPVLTIQKIQVVD
jgi:uncharacterized protein YgiM (DUF1202 family)